MGSYIEFNDTLKIHSDLLPSSLEVGKEYSFSLAGRRVFHAHPVRVFLVEEIGSKWNYLGHAQITKQTIDTATESTSGRFVVSQLYNEAYAAQANLYEAPSGKSFLPSGSEHPAGIARRHMASGEEGPYMRAAIEQASLGKRENGIPIGSVLVKDRQIIGRGYNRRIQDGDPMAHAEIDCLRNAGRVGSYHGAVLYSTLMPCYLCAGAVVQFKIGKVVAGEAESFPGAPDFLEAHGVVVENLDLEPCKQMMREFAAENPEAWAEDIGQHAGR